MISDMKSYRYETSVKTLVKECPFLVMADLDSPGSSVIKGL